MAIVPIIPLINNGLGWGSSYTPSEEKPCHVYYFRKEGNGRSAIMLYYPKLKDATPTSFHDGKEYYAYIVEQDGYKERVEYDPKTGRCKFTGELL